MRRKSEFEKWKEIDPWRMMSTEDRMEAYRLSNATLKAFPSSPMQNELHEQLNVILEKYGLPTTKLLRRP